MWVKIKGDMKYLFALMDEETRYWIAHEVADSNLPTMHKPCSGRGRKSWRNAPKFITAGLLSYHDEFNKEFTQL